MKRVLPDAVAKKRAKPSATRMHYRKGTTHSEHANRKGGKGGMLFDFKPGKKLGRPLGAKNRKTVLLQDALVMSGQIAGDLANITPGTAAHYANIEGLVAYFLEVALRNPDKWCDMAKALFPNQLNVSSTKNHTFAFRTREEWQQALRERGLPEIPFINVSASEVIEEARRERAHEANGHDE